MSRNRWHALTVLVCGLGLLALVWGRTPGQGGSAALPPAPAVSHPAPPFSLPQLNGEPLALAELASRPVVLNFWASWCLPCRAEMPELQRLHERLAAAGVVVLGVNQGEAAAAVERFRTEIGVDFPTLLDQRLGVSREYAVSSIPTTFFIDRAGVIRNIFIGPMTDAVLAERLRAIHP